MDNASDRFKATFVPIWHQGFNPSVLSAGTFLKVKGNNSRDTKGTQSLSMITAGHEAAVPSPIHPQSSASSQLPALTAITTVKTQTRPLLSSFQQFYHQVVTQFTFFSPPSFHIPSPSKLFPLFLPPPSIGVNKGFPLSIHRDPQLESVQKLCPLVPRKQQSSCLKWQKGSSIAKNSRGDARTLLE